MPTNAQGAAKCPETARQQDAQHTSSQQRTGAAMRKQRAVTWASMTTEYQERFRPPRGYTTIISTTTQNDPYHPLKGTNNDITTFSSFHVSKKWMKNTPKPPQPSLPPKDFKRHTQRHPVHSEANHMVDDKVDYTTVYKGDYRQWKASKRPPIKLKDSMEVIHGLVGTNYTKEEKKHMAVYSKPDQEPKPIASITSYRSDYIPHPVQPRPCRVKLQHPTNRGLLLEPVGCTRAKTALDTNKGILDEARIEFLKEFKTRSLEAKPSPPADHKLHSTKQAEDMAQKGTRALPPSMQTSEKSNEPFQVITTMKEEYKAWDAPHRRTAVCKGETNPKTSGQHPDMKETAACNSSCDASEKPRRVFAGFECSNGNEESRVYWSSSLGKEATWPEGDARVEPPQTCHIVSCMVSSRT